MVVCYQDGLALAPGSRWCASWHGVYVLRDGWLALGGHGRCALPVVIPPTVQRAPADSATSTTLCGIEGSTHKRNVIEPQERIKIQPKLLFRKNIERLGSQLEQELAQKD